LSEDLPIESYARIQYLNVTFRRINRRDPYKAKFLFKLERRFENPLCF